MHIGECRRKWRKKKKLCAAQRMAPASMECAMILPLHVILRFWTVWRQTTSSAPSPFALRFCSFPFHFFRFIFLFFRKYDMMICVRDYACLVHHRVHWERVSNRKCSLLLTMRIRTETDKHNHVTDTCASSICWTALVLHDIASFAKYK